ncbi:metal transporter [Hazenella sp. IB182357]|uniref:Metal transporter n=1 Tax=Polycladospora coralii TaxID=2771432 RepID=A0A926N8H9_9BACL|nr:metal transporter [Polycladospora coralii]MBD1371737.1 metal transporter [Polycladospora coralii]MBS7529204.1 ZIP family metal transporter [Polycladospora coralii]
MHTQTKKWFYGILPILLLAVAIFGMFQGIDKVLTRSDIPLEELTFDRVWAEEGKIHATVTNTGADPLTIAQLTLNDAIWEFETTKEQLNRFDSAEITVPIHWVEGEPYDVTIITGTGTVFSGEIAAAQLAPKADVSTYGMFALIGIFVGVIPVLLGMLWKPFIAKLGGKGYTFVLALTIGLLVFLGFDSLWEAIELAVEIPGAYQGIGLIVLAGLGTFLLLNGVSTYTESRQATGSDFNHKLTIAYLIALGIGIHNLGEGLAIGASFALGEVAMGAFLIMGFTLHNITEGLAIVAPVARESIKRSKLLLHLIALGLLGGVPAIFGTWIGGFVYSPVWSLIFLAIGSGAIFQVVVQVFHLEKQESNAGGLMTPAGITGLMVGIAVMYITALFVTA